jgi:putative salt-induced outer membrane protein YdiY
MNSTVKFKLLKSFITLFFLFCGALFGAQETLKVPDDKLIKIEDKSGMSADEIRQLAKKIDKLQSSPKQLRWEDLSPTPTTSDWIETKKGEWFRGKIKGLYDDKLEFDSDEIGIYTFDFDDIKSIKSYHMLSVNIENRESITGILRLEDQNVAIIQGDKKHLFSRSKIISFAPAAKLEKNFWTGKITLQLDMRGGNSKQFDYAAQANIKRRTAISALSFDYLGRISVVESIETSNDHRLNEKYDRYLTRNFFWTPLFSEYYTDKYKNIDAQITAGMGIGYRFINTKERVWSFSGGPAVIYTRFLTVEEGTKESNYSPALELSTKFEQELSAITDLTYSYKLTLSGRDSGLYKHHMIISFENEIFSWLDLDITAVWDYVAKPQENAEKIIPLKSDYQLLMGFGIEF